ncbi:MAG: DMT family transporter [Burkholderiaceae bacterium]
MRLTAGGGRRAPSLLAVFAVAALGIALFSVMDAVMKGLVLAIGAYTALLWRNLAGTVISGALYFARPRRSMKTRATLKVHVLRAVVSTVMALCFFWGLARMPMAQAVALTFIAPLLSLFLSAMLLGERIERTTVVASSIAFAGVAVILFGQWRADLDTAALEGAIAVLCSALFYAFNIVLMRRQALVAEPLEVAFSQSAIVTLLLAVGGPFFATFPAARHVPMLLLGAVLAVLSLLSLAWAYARSDASHLSTSEYTSFVWASLLGWLVFDERVTPFTLAGATLIVTGCVLAARFRPVAPIADLDAGR